MTPEATLTLAPYAEDEEVQEVLLQARTVADEARELEIVDDLTNMQAESMLSDCRKAARRFDELKKRWLKPFTDQVDLIRRDFDSMAAPVKEADQILSRKTSAYRFKLAEAARKDQERQRLLAEKRQERAAQRAEERGLEAPLVMPLVPTLTAPPKTVSTANGARITYRIQVHFEVEDSSLLPREYLMPDEKKIGGAVRSGVFSKDNPLPGVRIWTTEEPTVR